MQYLDYQGRQWKVITNTSTECPLNSIVTFHGPATSLGVRCRGVRRYGPGMYTSGKIELPNEGEITMTEATPEGAKSTITFSPMRGHFSPRTGSWTAEDNGPWSGED